jgi:hypothetical protein
MSIHLFTSVKGGVGKTLVSLGVICGAVRQNANPILGIDLNTTNPDLFNILSFNVPCTLPDASGWDLSILDDRTHLVVPQQPYILPDGAVGFWSKMQQVLSSPLYATGNWDVLVDTNLHIANLIIEGLGAGGDNVIQQILRVPGRTIYLWIFWTWAALQEKNIGYISTALELLMKRFPDRVCVAHVLNPSALIPPKINLSSRLELLEALKYLDQMPSHLKSIVERSQTLDDIKEELLRQFADSPELREYSIPGLSELAAERPCPPITFAQFRDIVGNIFKRINPGALPEEAFMPLYEEMKEKFNGCPRNIFSVATHNPKLIGYTDTFARNRPQDIDTVSEQIGETLQNAAYRFSRQLRCALFE